MKRFSILSLLIFSSLHLIAQFASICPSSTTPPSSNCAQACITCNFIGFQSSTAGYSSTPHNYGFCGDFDNNQWIGFVAGETSGTITAIPSNCENGDGIQIVLYPSCSASPIACNGGGSGGGPVSVNAINLTKGETYYIMIDGVFGDICDFTLVASPASLVMPTIPSAPTVLSGATSACPFSEEVYSTPMIDGASDYVWTAPPDATINGLPSPATISNADLGNVVTITFGSSSGVVCVSGSNLCHTGPPICTPVVVQPNPPNQLPNTTICTENLPYVTPWGEEVLNSGLYSNTYINPLECDSTVQQLVFVKPPLFTTLPPTILCPNEPITICGQQFTQPGNYNTVCTDLDGCDSTVNFTILLPDLDLEIIQGDVLVCPTLPVIISTAPVPANSVISWFEVGDPNPLTQGANSYLVTDYGEYIMKKEVPFSATNVCDFYDTISIVCTNTAPCNPPDITAFDASPTEANIAWNADFTAESYRIQYRVKGTTNWTSIARRGFPRNMYKLSGLTPNTIYECRVRQLCQNQNSPYSDIVTFSTDTNDTCSEPNDMSYGYFNDGSATKIRIFCDAEPNATRYQWRYREINTTSYTRRQSTNPLVNLSGLLPNTVYEYSVRVNCVGGWTSWLPNNLLKTLQVPNPISPLTSDDREDELNINNSFQIYPNPTSGELFISFENDDLPEVIQVYNSLGAKVLTFSNPNFVETIDVRHLPTGKYILQGVWTDGTLIAEPFVKL